MPSELVCEDVKINTKLEVIDLNSKTDKTQIWISKEGFEST